MARPREHCAQCGFDSDLYNRSDTITSQTVIPAVLRAAIEGLDGDVLRRRPDDSTWSIAEYIDHVREIAFGNRFAIESALAEPGINLGEPPAGGLTAGLKDVDVTAALAGVEKEYGAMRELLESLDDEQWQATATVSGDELPVGWFARHVVHDGLHHLEDIGRIRHGFGHGASTQTGRVHQLNTSNGGVPKRPVDTAKITPGGVQGDSQNDRRHHGRPVQAVCLWSADVIAELASDGHPIAAGNAGENVTVEGVTWHELRPGSRLRIGDIPMLVTAHAIPCAKNAQWFSDRDFNRILHDRNPGFSRLYAIPMESGVVRTGDMVTVEP